MNQSDGEEKEKRKETSPFHFKFNRITELDVWLYTVQYSGEFGGWVGGQLSVLPNVSVCCMNYQWEGGLWLCGLAAAEEIQIETSTHGSLV